METFTDIKWGVTKEKVINSSSSQLLINDENELVYKEKLFDKNILTKYVFFEGKLTRIIYSLMDRRKNIDDYMDDYDDFRTLLFMIVGEPELEDQWYDEKLDASLHMTSWNLQNSKLSCVLSIDDTGICCYVEYERVNPYEGLTIRVKSLSFKQ
jgi:hypothetical protein